MFTRPEGLPDSRVVDALRVGWGLGVDRIDYAAVGFGSYHWRITAGGVRWFVTADDLTARERDGSAPVVEPLRRLTAALSTARLLCDAGMGFVVAPRITRSGSVVHAVDERFAVALYPHVDGEAHTWGPYPSRLDRLVVLDLIAALHREGPESARCAPLVDDFVVQDRDQLVAALADRAGPWESGPFGEPARALLDAHAGRVSRVLEFYDGIAAAVTRQPGRMVVTHGEPHRANTITTAEGVMLIDWDTALLAPPERDVWALADEDPEVIDYYASRTGITPDGDALRLYRLRWDLTEIAIYIGQFRRPHRNTEDTQVAWDSLNHYLDPARTTSSRRS